MDVLHYEFMQRALVAAVLVGLAAPSVGVHLVQRRLALIGDGLGHVALAGVAIGVLSSRQPVWTALVAAVAGAVAIELIRARGRTSGDVALAVLFYGGIAGGVVIISQAPGGTPSNLNAYLFGAITTTSPAPPRGGLSGATGAGPLPGGGGRRGGAGTPRGPVGPLPPPPPPPSPP